MRRVVRTGPRGIRSYRVTSTVSNASKYERAAPPGEISRDRITAVDRVSTPVTVIPRPIDGSPRPGTLPASSSLPAEPDRSRLRVTPPDRTPTEIRGRGGRPVPILLGTPRYYTLLPPEMFSFSFGNTGRTDRRGGPGEETFRCYGIKSCFAYTSQLPITHSCQTRKEMSPRMSTRGWTEYDGV